MFTYHHLRTATGGISTQRSAELNVRGATKISDLLSDHRAPQHCSVSSKQPLTIEAFD